MLANLDCMELAKEVRATSNRTVAPLKCCPSKAPGFQTNVRRVRVTPAIAERLRRGEKVSPEEIAAASARMEEDEAQQPPTFSLPRAPIIERDDRNIPPVNEWLPESLTTPKKRGKGKKK